MLYYAIKTLLSAVIIVTVSEVAKRSSLLAGLVASLPLVSILAIIWLYLDTRDTGRVATLGREIFWLVLPSLAFFVVLPQLLQRGVNFWLSMWGASAVTAICYFITLRLIRA